MKAKLEIKNFQKLNDFEGEFLSGHLYLVKGNNGTGKTTFCRSWRTLLEATSTVESPVTFGEKDGQIIGTITNFHGEKDNNVKIIFDFNDDKKETFKLITKDTSVIKNKGEIRDFFKYNHFTVDEFFAWGKTAEGRRKQAKTLFELIPEKIRKEISEIDTLINEKNGTLFIARKDANDEHTRLKKSLETNVLTPDEIAAIGKEQAYRDKITAGEAKLKELSEAKDKNRDFEIVIEKLETMHDHVLDTELLTAERGKRMTEIFTEQIEEEKKKLIPTELAKIVEIEEAIVKIRAGLETIISLKTKKEQNDRNTIGVQKAFDEANRLTGELDKYRTRKKDLYASAKLDPHLEIIGDELYYLLDDGNHVPFDADSLSYSVAGLIVTDFIIRLNKTTPIILLGYAGEYDKIALAKLVRLAKENDAIIFGDKVIIDEDQDLTVEVYETT